MPTASQIKSRINMAANLSSVPARPEDAKLSYCPDRCKWRAQLTRGFLLDSFQIPGENRLGPGEMIIQRQQPMHETHHESTKSHNPNQARTLDKIGYHQTADEIVHL